MVIKDSMVLIHLAKISLLEESCNYFGQVFIPSLIKEEVTRGDYPNAIIIQKFIENGKIKVRRVHQTEFISKANQFNIQRGEAEALALYWELKADYLATDDDNVRKKRDLLQLNLIGTPVIILQLYKQKRISLAQFENSIKKCREIGWFANTIWDKIKLEVSKK